VEPTVFVTGGFQPTVAEIAPDHLVCCLRTHPNAQTVGGYVGVTESTDGGQTWSPIAVNGSRIENPDSGTDMVKLPNGHLVLLCNPQKQGRHRLTAFVSEDGGKTWPIHRDLENQLTGEFSYPAIICDARGTLHATYTYQRLTIKHACFDEEWIRAAP
jgi:predicted neuraminidase